ncbi:hypothetical protein CDU00_20905 [Cronobacter sakazakii]|nr:hypothetical protein CDU00_20905 [Cronobacter sakazakii]PUY19829.1 hypothetical protein BTK72_04450 [Cronobacter sakazakii]UXD93291.1 hypothetical protein K2Y34_04250 [Cronobacter sakazakii]HAU5438120.1 hypothetical protein [Cronobacter sakazakii]
MKNGLPVDYDDLLPHNPVHGNGGGGGGDDMLQRVKDLEKDAQQMKTDIAVMRSNYATKSDVSDAKNSIILWVVGAVVMAQLIPAMPAIITAIKTMAK